MENSGSHIFQPWGFEHGVVLIITAVIAILMLVNAKRIRGIGDDRVFRYILAAFLLVNMLFTFFYYLQFGILKLPLQLCDLAVLLMVLALIIKNRIVGELAFYWGLAGSSQAVLTPDLRAGFPDITFFQFFFSHCAVIFSAIYIAIRGRVHFTMGSFWRVLIAVNIYIGIVGLIDWIFGLNFAYLAAKPAQPSVLDFFGPWPYYILGGELIAVVLFSIFYTFGRFIERVSTKHSGTV